MEDNYLFFGEKCSLEEILCCRERRVERYSEVLCNTNCKNAVTVCINMPGAVKKNKASEILYKACISLMKTTLVPEVTFLETSGKTGYECFFTTNQNSVELKKKFVDSESEYQWLRMIDIDVIDKDTRHISRLDLGYASSKCFVCDNEAKVCASRQIHTEKEIKTKIKEYCSDAYSYLLATYATESLICEATVGPKPGLVDRFNNGSHKDMTLEMFIKSATTLEPFFERMVLSGVNNKSFEDLRSIGIEAEKAMLSATGNVNTHKGAIFCLGILCYCFGNLFERDSVHSNKNINKAVKQLVGRITKEEDKTTKRKYGSGARGAAQNGYRFITLKTLPFFEKILGKTNNIEDAMVTTLLFIISENEDSNILRRSDRKTLKWAQKQTKNLLKSDTDVAEIRRLDKEFIEKNISPGGSADLLAATYFIHLVTLL